MECLEIVDVGTDGVERDVVAVASVGLRERMHRGRNDESCASLYNLSLIDDLTFPSSCPFRKVSQQSSIDLNFHSNLDSFHDGP